MEQPLRAPAAVWQTAAGARRAPGSTSEREVGEMAGDTERLVPMESLKSFRVAADCPDPRGWDVIGADGATAGEVEEMLVDTTALSVRYLDVCLDRTLTGGVKDRHVLIPVGSAELEATSECVHVQELSAAAVAALPEYTSGRVTRDLEVRLRDAFSGIAAFAAHPLRRAEDRGEAPAEDFYAHPLFDTRRFWGRRKSDPRDPPP
jgi:photosynthetic reaction center H subunit